MTLLSLYCVEMGNIVALETKEISGPAVMGLGWLAHDYRVLGYYLPTNLMAPLSAVWMRDNLYGG